MLDYVVANWTYYRNELYKLPVELRYSINLKYFTLFEKNTNITVDIHCPDVSSWDIMSSIYAQGWRSYKWVELKGPTLDFHLECRQIDVFRLNVYTFEYYYFYIFQGKLVVIMEQRYEGEPIEYFVKEGISKRSLVYTNSYIDKTIVPVEYELYKDIFKIFDVNPYIDLY